MKTLIVEDEITSRVMLRSILQRYGAPRVALNGLEGVEAVSGALKAGEPFDLICLDIMMPEMNGQEVLKRIREMETEFGIPVDKRAKVIMTTAHADKENVMAAIAGQCDYFLVKPVDGRILIDELKRLGLIARESPGRA